jgi:hypothetical protein
LSRLPSDGRLSPELFSYLQAHHPIVVVTVGADGRPAADLVSWVLALDDHTVRLVIGVQRPAATNIRTTGLASLQVLGRGLAYEVKGSARIIKERCESIRFPQMMVELRVDSVRENMYPANFVTGDVPVGWPESTETYHSAWNAAIADEMRRERSATCSLG